MCMDFVGGLSKARIILVVVDKRTKYAHIVALSYPFTAKKVVEVSLKRSCNTAWGSRSDRDKIFQFNLVRAVQPSRHGVEV